MSETTRGYYQGYRVQLAPHLDDWMKGDRYGEIIAVSKTRLRVKLDKSGKVRSIRPADVVVIEHGNSPEGRLTATKSAVADAVNEAEDMLHDLVTGSVKGVELASGSAWGIESDSGRDYFAEVAREIIAEHTAGALTKRAELARKLAHAVQEGAQ